MADRVDLVREFTKVTSADVSTAQFYLESHRWDLSAAVAAFYEVGTGPGSDANPAPGPPQVVGKWRNNQQDGVQSLMRRWGPYS